MMRMLGVILLASSAAGCQVCGTVGAVQGLELQVAVQNGTLPPGDYEIVVDADGLELTYAETLDATNVVQGGPSEIADGDKHLYIDGGVFAANGDLIVGYREGGGPATVMVSVKQGTTVLGSQVYAPSYEVSYPNGEECPPAQLHAQGTITLTAP